MMTWQLLASKGLWYWRLIRNWMLLLATHHLIVIVILVTQLIQLLFKRCNVVDRFFQDHCFRVLRAFAKGDGILQQLEAAIDIFSSTLLRQNMSMATR